MTPEIQNRLDKILRGAYDQCMTVIEKEHDRQFIVGYVEGVATILLSEISTYEEKLKKAEEALKHLPEQLRSQMDGHKGQAYRIATQLCEETLSLLSQ